MKVEMQFFAYFFSASEKKVRVNSQTEFIFHKRAVVLQHKSSDVLRLGLFRLRDNFKSYSTY